MTHHVLHVDREHRLPILVDLASAPGRTMVFTRTKHGAKALARQLNRSGVPAVELHGNLGQNARTRNLRGLPRRQGRGAGRHRHRRPRHPRRRRRAGRPRRPAGRAQGLPAPLRPYGARGQRRHRRHADDQRAGPRRPRPDPRRRHQADHHTHPGLHPPGPGRAGPRRAHADRGPGDSCRVVAPDTLRWRRRRRAQPAPSSPGHERPGWRTAVGQARVVVQPVVQPVLVAQSARPRQRRAYLVGWRPQRRLVQLRPTLTLVVLRSDRQR